MEHSPTPLATTAREFRPVRRPVVVGASCFVIVGTAHLLVMLGSVIAGPGVASDKALDAMRVAESSLLGIDRNMAAMYDGFSALMALLAINLTTGVCSLGVAALAFPLPAIVVLGIAVAVFVWALIEKTLHGRPT